MKERYRGGNRKREIGEREMEGEWGREGRKRIREIEEGDRGGREKVDRESTVQSPTTTMRSAARQSPPIPVYRNTNLTPNSPQ